MSGLAVPQLQEMALLTEFSQWLAEPNIGQAVVRVIHRLMEAVDASTVQFIVFDEEVGRTLPFLQALESEPQIRIVREVDERIERIAGDRKTSIDSVTQSILYMPLVYEDRAQAIIKLARADMLPFQEHHQYLATAVVNQLGLALENALLKERVKALTEQTRFKNEMLQMASHDLRTPLALIDSYTEMIALDTPASLPSIHKSLDVLRLATARVWRMLDDLLRAEQIRTSPLELHEPLNPTDLVELVVENARPLLEEKHQQLEMRLQLANGTDHLVADPALIRGAMSDLLTNATKYTPAGGHIVVHAFMRDSKFHFEVEDNGIGIGKQHLTRIFDPLYRVKRPGTEQIEGTGLGLSLVKTAIERHQGQVWVESEEGKGSRFGFWVPVRPFSPKEDNLDPTAAAV